MNPNWILSAVKNFNSCSYHQLASGIWSMPAKATFHSIVTKRLPIKFYVKHTRKLLIADTQPTEARTKEEQSTDGYSKRKKGRKAGKWVYCAGKEQGVTNNNSMGCLKAWEGSGTNSTDASPRTEEDDNGKRVQRIRSRAWSLRSLTEALISPVKQYRFLFLVKRTNNFLAQITDFRLKKVLFVVSFQSSFQLPG